MLERTGIWPDAFFFKREERHRRPLPTERHKDNDDRLGAGHATSLRAPGRAVHDGGGHPGGVSSDRYRVPATSVGRPAITGWWDRKDASSAAGSAGAGACRALGSPSLTRSRA
ncbi:hypothetical protein GCM10010330_80660 [Streptomyces tendae]|nr:hypothetical protein GCM10010330_80660 [Streptomyces tendae]